MWNLHVTMNENNSCIILEMKVSPSSNFNDYLTSKLHLYPVYIQSEYKRFRLIKPYRIRIVSDLQKEIKDVRLLINHTIRIPVPFHISNRKQEYIDMLMNLLMTWIEEEYELYQSDWKRLAGSYSL